MFKSLTIALAAFVLPAAASAATTVEIAPDTADRMVTVSSFQPIGQSFTPITDTLSSFGFRFGTLNASRANTPLTFDLYRGERLSGDSLFNTTFSLPDTIRQRGDLAWVDIALPDLVVSTGSLYTAVLRASSARAGLQVGPGYSYSPPMLKSGDVYAGGRLLTDNPSIYPNCTGAANNCDAVFRFTGNDAVAAVPEPGTWALLLIGFAMAGGMMRRREPGAGRRILARI